MAGGVLAGKAIQSPQPPYPAMARAAGIEGAVVVELTVSESGGVQSARAISGHPLLRDAAVQAARGWAFSPTMLSGVQVKVVGTIAFDFKLPWARLRNANLDRRDRPTKCRVLDDLVDADVSVGNPGDDLVLATHCRN